MGASVHPVDDKVQPIAHLVAGQSLGEHPADNGLGDLATVPDILRSSAMPWMVGNEVILLDWKCANADYADYLYQLAA